MSALDKLLAEHRVVVVVFHTPGSDLDAAAVREARAGATAAGSGYLAVDVTKEGAVADLAAEYEVLEAPTVLVIVRSGEAVSRFDDIVDRTTVAQAADERTPVSEAAVEPQELALRSARKDGREIVRLRYVEERTTFLVECEVYPLGGLRVEPLRPGPYRFGTRDEADTFIRETITILEYLGCDVT